MILTTFVWVIENKMTTLNNMPIEIIEKIFSTIGRLHPSGPEDAYNFILSLFYFTPEGGGVYDVTVRGLFGGSPPSEGLKRYRYKKYSLANSIKYYTDPEYRMNEASAVADTSTQISLCLYNCKCVTTVENISNVHTLNLGYCENLIDVTCLGNIYDLMLNGCKQLTNFSNLGKVYRLDLVKCNIEKVDDLGEVHTLNLSGCINVSDVNCLSSVHTLYLNDCVKVKDVSNLGRCHTLDLSGCINVSLPLTGLFSVHDLIKDDCLPRERRRRRR